MVSKKENNQDVGGLVYYFNIRAKFKEVSYIEKGGFILDDDKTIVSDFDIKIDSGEVIFTILSEDDEIIYEKTVNSSIQEKEEVYIPAGTCYYTLEYIKAKNGEISIDGIEKSE